jgi:hypothetical protein
MRKMAEKDCQGCAAKDKEIEFLQRQLEAMQDRMFAMNNPAAYQIYKGQPLTVNPTVPGAGTENGQVNPETGEVEMFIGGKAVSQQEFMKTMDKLEEQMSGRSPGSGDELPI